MITSLHKNLYGRMRKWGLQVREGSVLWLILILSEQKGDEEKKGSVC